MRHRSRSVHLAALVPGAIISISALAQEQERVAGELNLEQRTLTTASGVTLEAELGTFVVPEFRGDPDSPLITLSFGRLKCTGAEPRAPLFYLAGGPGGSALSMASSPEALDNWLAPLEVCDLVFLDQRGTGRSEPDLVWSITEPLPDDILVDYGVTRSFMVDQAKQARAHFEAQGHDLRGYTTLEAAHDMNDLREALGYDSFSVMGFSYGTHLGLATIKYFGEHVESAILIGVEGLDETFKYPLNMDVQFRKLSALAARDPSVGQRVPDMVELYQRVASKLEREPAVVQVGNASGETVNIRVGKLGLDLILRFDIGDASDIPVFPRLLYSLDQGDTRILQWFVQKRYPLFSQINAMMFLTDASSGASEGRLLEIERQAEWSMFGNVVNALFDDLGEALGAPDLGEEYRAPFVSNVRTLFLTSSLDWNTPPYQAERVRWGFVDGTHITVNNAGHEQVIPQPEVQRIMLDFLRGEEVADADITLPPLRFVPIEGNDPFATHPSVPGQ